MSLGDKESLAKGKGVFGDGESEGSLTAKMKCRRTEIRYKAHQADNSAMNEEVQKLSRNLEV